MSTDVQDQGTGIPQEYSLQQNYPNPFNPSTSISYQLPANGFVSLKVFDMLGREVATLVNEVKNAGTYSATWNAAGFGSGIYFCKMQATLDQTVGQTLASRRQKLRKMFPAATDKEIATLLENVHRETQAQIARTANTVFVPHLNSIQHILGDLEKIQQTEPVAAGPEINSWQMAFLFVDAFTAEFKDLALTGSSQPQPIQP